MKQGRSSRMQNLVSAAYHGRTKKVLRIGIIAGENFYVYGEGKTERGAWLKAAARIKDK